jgi:CBS domain-containing protein
MQACPLDPGDRPSRGGFAMQCQEIMKQEIECVSIDESICEAARRMRDENIGFLPVCDESMKVLGTLTDRDIVIRLVAENGSGNVRVGDVMTREAVCCKPDDDVHRAQQLMGERHVSRIMCVDDQGCLVGIISLSDLAQYDYSDQAIRTMR